MTTRDMTIETFADVIREGIVLLDWWATWCGPCRAFAPVYEAASERHGGVVFGRIDIEAQPGLAAAFAIRAVPTLMVFRDGILLSRESGILGAEGLDGLIARIAALDMAEIRARIAAAEARDQRVG